MTKFNARPHDEETCLSCLCHECLAFLRVKVMYTSSFFFGQYVHQLFSCLISEVLSNLTVEQN